MRWKPLALFAACLCLLAGFTSRAQSASQLAHAVDGHYNHLQTLQAHFVERYQGPGYDRSEAGTLLLAKPGRMRWTYDSPAGKLFLVNGTDAIAYTPGDSTATRLPAKQLADFRSPLGLLLGQTHLERELSALSAAPQSPGTYTLTGTPRGSLGRQLQQVQLTVTAAGQIQQLILRNTDGSTLHFTFSQQKENVPAAAANFQFTPPPGVVLTSGPQTE